jgi:hypothetical protein
VNPRLRSFVLWIGVPLCIALAVTGLQVFWPGIYWRETRLGAAGAFASDLIDLSLVLPVLTVAAVLAVRGSLRALLVWAGTLGFLVYNFLIYAFEVRFNAMFLAYCAVLGLSFYGLIGLREFLAPDEAAKRCAFDVTRQRAPGRGAPRRTTAVAFLVVAVFAAFGEVKEIVTATYAGQTPPSITPGQATNPIHVLDLCFLLPVVATAAILLLRRKAIGFTLAPPLLVTMILISLEVLTIMAVFARRGLPIALEPVISFGVCATFLTVLLVWFLRSARRAAPQAGTPV